jgi:hypothetical protein
MSQPLYLPPLTCSSSFRSHGSPTVLVGFPLVHSHMAKRRFACCTLAAGQSGERAASACSVG